MRGSGSGDGGSVGTMSDSWASVPEQQAKHISNPMRDRDFGSIVVSRLAACAQQLEYTLGQECMKTLHNFASPENAHLCSHIVASTY